MTINVFGGGYNPLAPAFPVQRSVRLRSSASAYFGRTLTTPTNNKIWTWSAWVKRGKASGASAAALHLFGTGSGSNDAGTTQIYFESESLILGGYSTPWLKSNAVYRDPSAWYHIVVAWDNSNATATNRAKIYVNGVEITYVTDNRASLSTTSTYGINQAVLHTIGAWSWNNGTFAQPEYYDGYLTEINFIDGQALTPTSFGAYKSYGVWSPAKYTGSYGTNGFYLNFQDNSAATAAAIGKDSSGNGNNWTPNNISVTAGVTYDSMTDVPTLTSATTANYAVLNPLSQSTGGSAVPSNGNLTLSQATNNIQVASTIGMSAGKWYYEHTITTLGGENSVGIGLSTAAAAAGTTTGQYGYYFNGNKYINGSVSAYGAAYTTGDVIGVAYDADTGSLTFYKNGTSQGVATTGLTGTMFALAATRLAGGQNSSNLNFGQRPFSYTPPTGFVALNTYNLPTPTIANGATQFAATTYTGTGVAQNINNSVNGISFQPDLVWVKARSFAYSHRLANSITGATNYLDTAQTAAQFTDAGNSISSFNSNGFGVGTYVSANNNTTTYVGWQWKASNATAVTNTAGSITSSVSANPSAGFSIVSFTGVPNNASTYTIGHGLGVAPKFIIAKNRDIVDDWYCYQESIGATKRISLNTTAAAAIGGIWGNTAPTSSVFSLVGNAMSTSTSQNLIAYCFSEIAGYSKFGSYTGNGSTDGPFVYTGFRPRWIMFKKSSATSNWSIVDTSRDTFNVTDNPLLPNTSGAETTSTSTSGAFLDILSNGFKLRGNSGDINDNTATYIYAAFAENPFSYSLAR